MTLFKRIKFEKEHFNIVENDFRKLLIIAENIKTPWEQRWSIEGFYGELLLLHLRLEEFNKLPLIAKKIIYRWVSSIKNILSDDSEYNKDWEV